MVVNYQLDNNSENDERTVLTHENKAQIVLPVQCWKKKHEMLDVEIFTKPYIKKHQKDPAIKSLMEEAKYKINDNGNDQGMDIDNYDNSPPPLPQPGDPLSQITEASHESQLSSILSQADQTIHDSL